MECNVTARPPAHSVTWLRRRGQEEQEVGRGRLLLLANVTREDEGLYTCRAVSSEGEGEAPHPLALEVHYRPVCGVTETLPHPADAGGQPGVDLRCDVEASPVARSFRWLYNSTEGSFEIPSAKSLMSFMNYAVSNSSVSEQHGQVLCWASNSVGEQTEPCVFHVVPLGAPGPPEQCDVRGRQQKTLGVGCTSPADGVDTTYVLEVFRPVNGSQELVATNWSRQPSVSVDGLQPNTSYILALHAANSKGRSAAVYMAGHTGVEEASPSLSLDRLPVLYVIVAALLSVMLLSLVLSIAAACRRRVIYSREKDTILSGVQETAQSPSSSSPLLPSSPSHQSLQRRVSFKKCTCGSRSSLLPPASPPVTHSTLDGTRRDSRCCCS